MIGVVPYPAVIDAANPSRRQLLVVSRAGQTPLGRTAAVIYVVRPAVLVDAALPPERQLLVAEGRRHVRVLVSHPNVPSGVCTTDVWKKCHSCGPSFRG